MGKQSYYVEIERRFLLDSFWKEYLPDSMISHDLIIMQGYLKYTAKKQERVRHEIDWNSRNSIKFEHTKKRISEDGLVREEETDLIGREKFDSLWEKCDVKFTKFRKVLIVPNPRIYVSICIDIYDEITAVMEAEYRKRPQNRAFPLISLPILREITSDPMSSNYEMGKRLMLGNTAHPDFMQFGSWL